MPCFYIIFRPPSESEVFLELTSTMTAIYRWVAGFLACSLVLLCFTLPTLGQWWERCHHSQERLRLIGRKVQIQHYSAPRGDPGRCLYKHYWRPGRKGGSRGASVCFHLWRFGQWKDAHNHGWWRRPSWYPSSCSLSYLSPYWGTNWPECQNPAKGLQQSFRCDHFSSEGRRENQG